ncbi:MAG: ABC-2 transporter permease [Tissierellia bacterium]|nr:ABC-2 transporter permease [Tissierellia bacterium]
MIGFLQKDIRLLKSSSGIIFLLFILLGVGYSIYLGFIGIFIAVLGYLGIIFANKLFYLDRKEEFEVFAFTTPKGIKGYLKGKLLLFYLLDLMIGILSFGALLKMGAFFSIALKAALIGTSFFLIIHMIISLIYIIFGDKGNAIVGLLVIAMIFPGSRFFGKYISNSFPSLFSFNLDKMTILFLTTTIILTGIVYFGGYHIYKSKDF